MSDAKTVPAYEGWAILELMGHRRLGGWISETTFAGKAFVRIDVPGPNARRGEGLLPVLTPSSGEGFVATQLYNGDAVYCLTPCSWEAAFAAATVHQPTPIQRWELPAPENANSRGDLDDDDLDDDDLDPPF